MGEQLAVRQWHPRPLSKGPDTLQWPCVHAAGSGGHDGVPATCYDAPHKDALEPLYNVRAVVAKCFAAAPTAVREALDEQVAATATRRRRAASNDTLIPELKDLCVARAIKPPDDAGRLELYAPATALPRVLGIIAADAAKRSDLPSGTVM